VATINLAGITRDTNECNALNLGGHERGGSTGVMLIKEPMVDLDDSTSSHNFDDFEDLDGGSDLGVGEGSRSLLDYICA